MDILGRFSMDFFLVILGLIALTSAGPLEKTTPEVMEAPPLVLWRQYCEGASLFGTDGVSFVYCKKSNGADRKLTWPNVPPEPPKDQVVFVQPPSHAYKHEITIDDEEPQPEQRPKTVIFVKQPKNTHEISVIKRRKQVSLDPKPVVYYLKDNEESGTGIRSRRESVNEMLALMQADAAGMNSPLPVSEEDSASDEVISQASEVKTEITDNNPITTRAVPPEGVTYVYSQPVYSFGSKVNSQVADMPTADYNAINEVNDLDSSTSKIIDSAIREDPDSAQYFLNDKPDDTAVVGLSSRRGSPVFKSVKDASLTTHSESDEDRQTKTVVSIFKSTRSVLN